MAEDTLRLWNAWRTRRDARAFEELVRPDLGRAVAFARAMGCPADEAEDAVQESLVRLAGETGGEPARVGVRGWFFGIVRDRARAHRRADRRRHDREREAAVPEATHAPEPGADLREQVDRSLALLPEEDREAVRLRFLLDLEYREVAVILGASEGACRVRVHRALGKLRSSLGAGAAAILASVAVPTPARAATWVQSAVTSAPSVSAATLTGGTLLMTTAQKVIVAGIALACAGLGVAVGAGVAGRSQPGNSPVGTTGPSAPNVADLRRQLSAIQREREDLVRARDALAMENESLRKSTATGRSKDDGSASPGSPKGSPSAAIFGPPSDLMRKASELSGVWIQDITQVQDAARRDAGIAALREGIQSGDPVRILAGLMAITGTANIAYDRSSLRPPVLEALNAGEGEIRRAAMTTLFMTGPQPGDIDLLLAKKDDASPLVRNALPFILTRFTKGAVEGEVGVLVLRSMDETRADPKEFKLAIAQIRWGKISPEVEKKLLALAHDEDKDIRYNTIYFALSRLEEKTAAIVDELISLLDDPDPNISSQALTGLTRGIPPALAPKVAPVLVKLLESKRVDSQDWNSCLWGLQQIGTEAEIPALETMAANPLLPEAAQKQVSAVVAFLRRRIGR